MASILKVNEIQNASGTSALSVDLSGNAAFTGDVQADGVYNQSGDSDSGLDLSTNDVVAVKTGNTERLRVDNAGNLLVGKTSSSTSVDGTTIFSSGYLATTVAQGTANSGSVAQFRRNTSDGDLLSFSKDGSTVGSIGNSGTACGLSSGAGWSIFIGNSGLTPRTQNFSANLDNSKDLGASNARWDDIYATNGTIQTSDRNEKQDIAALTATEMLVAARISAMFKTFRWIDKAAENPSARTHTGIIAQDVQQAFTDEGLDAGDYALFISSTWEDENGNSQTRMGIRYPELLSFIAAYNEQRFASIETRLAALETPA